MTVNLHLPPEIEAGLLAEAQARGISVDVLLETLIQQLAQDNHSEEKSGSEARMLQQDDGSFALQVGRRITVDDVNDTLAAIRQERDFRNLGIRR